MRLPKGFRDLERIDLGDDRLPERRELYSYIAQRHLIASIGMMDHAWRDLQTAIENRYAFILPYNAHLLLKYIDLVSYNMIQVFFVNERSDDLRGIRYSGTVPLEIETMLSDIGLRRDGIRRDASIALENFVREERQRRRVR